MGHGSPASRLGVLASGMSGDTIGLVKLADCQERLALNL